jgi:fructose-1,6-bisphosphatase/inositol monophosphatase family enzyme
MTTNGADAADVLLARDIAREAVGAISAGYRDLVANLRGDAHVAHLVEQSAAEIAAATAAEERNLATRRLFARVFTSNFIGRYRKSNAELVSHGEKEAGALIRRRLVVERPRDGHKGEETGKIGSRSGRWWLDDPVDGTAAMLKTAISEAFSLGYSEPTPAFATTLALVEEGTATIGVVAELRPDYDMYLAGKRETPPGTSGLRIANMWVGSRTALGYETETVVGEPLPSPPPLPSECGSAAQIFTTAPEVMFRDTSRRRDYVREGGFEALLAGMGRDEPVVDGNIVGILRTTNGRSVAYERDLTAEDIAAALPILMGRGVVLSDDEGRPVVFDDLDKEYVVVAGTRHLWRTAVDYIRKGRAEAAELAGGPDFSRPPHRFFDALFAGYTATGYEQKSTGATQEDGALRPWTK